MKALAPCLARSWDRKRTRRIAITCTSIWRPASKVLSASKREGVGGLRTINSQLTEIVCRIFQAYVDGEAPRSIAKMRELEGVPGPSGGSWGPSTINGSLRVPCYLPV